MKKIEVLEQQYKELREAIDKANNHNETELNFLLEGYKDLCMEIMEELVINNSDVLKRLKEI